MDHTLYFDGSSLDRGRRGGPGGSAGAAILLGPEGEVARTSVFLRSGDSSSAEYTGLLSGLDLVLSRGIHAVAIFGDSRVVIDHIKRFKNPKRKDLIELRDEAFIRLSQIETWTLHWIPRSRNSLADEESRRCLNQG